MPTTGWETFLPEHPPRRLTAVAFGCLGLVAGGRGLAQNFGNPFLNAPNLPPTISPAQTSDAPLQEELPGDSFLVRQGMPFRPPPSPGDYDFKLGAFRVGFNAGLGISYNDNIFFVPNAPGLARVGDFSLDPRIGINLNLPVNPTTTLDLSMGIGYHLVVSHSQLDMLTINPNSLLHYDLYVGSVRVSFFNQMGTSAIGAAGAQVVGNGSAGAINLQRFQDAAGVSSAWPVTAHTTLSLGYTAQTDIGLNSAFSQLDRVANNFTTAGYYRFAPQWTAGLAANATLNTYLEPGQQDSVGYGIGPLLQWQPSHFLNVSTSFRYSIFSFNSPSSSVTNNPGAISGATSFTGILYNVSLAHTINRRMSHVLSFDRGLNYVLGNNYTEQTSYGYRFHWSLTPKVGLSLNATYIQESPSGAGFTLYTPPPGSLYNPGPPPEIIPPSGSPVILSPGTLLFPSGLFAIPVPGERPSTLVAGCGVSYAVNRSLNTQLSYTYQKRFSNFSDREYDDNLVGITFTFRF